MQAWIKRVLKAARQVDPLAEELGSTARLDGPQVLLRVPLASTTAVLQALRGLCGVTSALPRPALSGAPRPASAASTDLEVTGPWPRPCRQRLLLLTSVALMVASLALLALCAARFWQTS